MAEEYSGELTANSGAADSDTGDVRTETQLIECKHKGCFEKPVKSMSINLAILEKIWNEAVQQGREPVLCFRMYVPKDGHPLTRGGFIDLSIRLASSDASLVNLVESIG